MQEFFYTIVSIWLIYKLFDVFSPRAKQNYAQQDPRPKEGEVKIDVSKNNPSKFSDKEGEYVDYEEIK